MEHQPLYFRSGTIAQSIPSKLQEIVSDLEYLVLFFYRWDLFCSRFDFSEHFDWCPLVVKFF
jgi:hypothetical protein